MSRKKAAERQHFPPQPDPFRILADNSPEIIARYDKDLKYLYVNPSIRTVAPLAPDDCIGKTDGDLPVPEAMAQPLRKTARKVFATGRQQSAQFFLPEGKGGRHFDLLMVPEPGPEGTVTAVLSLMHDITRFKQTEEQTRANCDAARQGRILAENSRDIIMRFDRQHRYVYINPVGTALLGPGRTREDFIGKTNEELGVSPKTRGLLEEKFQEVLVSRKLLTFIWSAPAENPSRFYQSSLYPELDAAGEVISVIAVSRNITDLKKTEETLYGHLAMRDAFFSSAPCVLTILDEDLRFLYTDSLTPAYAGLDRKSIIGKPLKEVFPDLFRLYNTHLKAILETGEAIRNEEVVIPERGAIKDDRHYRVSGFLVPLPGGKRGIGIVAINITDMKRTEGTLRRSEREFRTLAENSPNQIIRLGRDLRNIYVNPAAVKLTGTDQRGKTWREAGFPEELCAQWEEKAEKIFETGLPEQTEFSMETPEGLRHFHASGVPETDDTGRVCSLLIITRDVTEQKELSVRLQDEQSKLREIIDNIPSGVVVVDRRGKPLLLNQSAGTLLRISAVPDSSFSGHGVSIRYLHPDGKPYTRTDIPLVRSAAKGETHRDVHMLAMLPNDVLRHLLVNTTPLHDTKGRCIGAIGSFTDITPIKEAEAVLRRDREMLATIVEKGAQELLEARIVIEKAKRLSDIGLLASTIAHEIRNPLAAIKTAAYNIRRKAGDQRIGKNLSTIEKKVAESDLIIHNLLAYSRMRAPNFEPVALLPLLNECFEDIRAKYSSWNIRLRKQLSFLGDGTIRADATHLRILFSNILDNAVQSLPGKTGAITLKARSGRNRVELEFQDSGTGIPADNLAKVFEPFFTTKSRGTGLGLTICRQIVDLHNGTIDINSIPGEGTTVRIGLPSRHI